MSYVELHARSAFSFLEGTSVPEELASACAERDFSAMALLDRDGVFGAPRFYLAAKKLSVRAHIGAEITSTKGWRYSLLVETREGYRNLCRLITRMKLRAAKGQACAEPNDLREFSSGLICLTGGEEGPLANALRSGGFARGIECVRELCDIFGCENVYIELQRHFSREEETRNQAACEIARRLHLPLLATNGVCHALPQEREILDVFTALHHHCTLDNAGRLLARNAERHLKTPAAMAALFADIPEAIANTELLSSRLQFTLKDLGYAFPKYPVPGGGTEIQFLRELAHSGMLWRYDADDKKAQKQIARELALIEKLNLAGYFLIVWDIVRFCREHSILVQGRGSAANSAVCYALGITAVDPVKMDLLFERFLSEERGEWPDIDLDLPSGEQRERAIQYVYQRYGQLGAAMTANVITYRDRSAAREIGKALSFEQETIDRLARLVGTFEYKDENDALDRHFRSAGLNFQHPRIRKFFQLCQMVQDLPRHLGQHSGGMVVCQGQLDSVVPLEPATMPGRVVVQWDKEDCADMGMIKVDLLGLGMMAAIEDSLQLIREDYKEEVDLAHLPPDDPAVYNALQQADTVGMFQIESRAQMSCLPRLRPKCFYDIVVQVAIIRPGPIVGDMVNPYLKRRQGREPATCLHPSLEPVLKRTLGVPLFQEQLLRMAMIAAGFTGGEAEELRRAFGFKRSEQRMKDIEKKLRAGMNRNSITGEAQDKIVQSIVSFALYGFPESHAASFALIAYASAYLKCHYLAAFTAALLNNQPMGFYSPATLVKDAQRHGLRVRPVDVTCSDWLCTLERTQQVRQGAGLQFARNTIFCHPEERFHREEALASDEESAVSFENKCEEQAPRNVPSASASDEVKYKKDFSLRLGLRYIKGLSENAARAIVRQRELHPFSSIENLRLRVLEMTKSELTALAEAGALNFISGSNGKNVGHRRDALWQVERASRSAGQLMESIQEFEKQTGENHQAIAGIRKTSPLSQMTVEERLIADFRRTGMTVGPHPLAFYRTALRKRGIRSAEEIRHLPDGILVRIAGAVIARQRPGTAKGFVFLSLEDETGIANAILTPQIFLANRATVVYERFLLIEGRLQNLEGVISVKAHSVQPLAVARAETVSHDFH